MKIYLSHASNPDLERELYEAIKASGLYTSHEFFLPHESQNIDRNLKDFVGELGLMVAETSKSSTGQGIELGRADAADVPIICFYRQGTEPSGSLRFVTKNVFSYSSTGEMLAKLGEYIDSMAVKPVAADPTAG